MFNGFIVRNFEFIQLIGSGGMGEIWSARRTNLGDTVAVKILKANKYDDLVKAYRNFEKEAQATSLINHPNVCKVYDYFEENNNYYLIMEYLEGFDLSRALLMTKEDPGENYKFGLYICRQVLRALNVAHNLNTPTVSKILHRDIKPANIFITVHNEVKLLDLGIAKIETDFDTTHNTQIGYSKNYSSPDLWENGIYKGERYAEIHDLYSLSLVFKEICEHQLPQIASPHFRSVFDRWNAEKQADRIQTTAEILHEVEVECERLVVNDFILKRVSKLAQQTRQDTTKPKPVIKPKKTKFRIFVGVFSVVVIILAIGFSQKMKTNVLDNNKDFTIHVPLKNWKVRLGAISNSQIKLDELSCKKVGDVEACLLPDAPDLGAPGSIDFRLGLDGQRNIQFIDYGVYGEDESRELAKEIRDQLKIKKFEFDKDFNGYVVPGALVTLGRQVGDFHSVSLMTSNLYELKHLNKTKESNTPTHLKASNFSFVLTIKELSDIKFGLLPGLHEKVREFSSCRNWSNVEILCTLASNKEKTLQNEEDFKMHFNFENNETNFIQFSFRTNSLYTKFINKISNTPNLIPARQETGLKVWYSQTEIIDLSKVTFFGGYAYTLSIRRANPEWLAEVQKNGFIDFAPK